MSAPQVAILSGPNGAGKSTLAERIIRDQLGILDYVNADTIAKGLSAFDSESQAFTAGRYMLEHLQRLATAKADFAFETTLATRSFATWIDDLLSDGYQFGIIFVWLPSADVSVRRVAYRVQHGGHHVPEQDIRRRFARGWSNFFSLYRPRATWWQVYNGASEMGPQLVADGSADVTLNVLDAPTWQLISREV